MYTIVSKVGNILQAVSEDAARPGSLLRKVKEQKLVLTLSGCVRVAAVQLR